MLIKIENGVPVGYPLIEDNFRQLFPSEVFPLVLTNEIVGPFGYAMYDFSQMPEVRWDQKLIEGTPICDQYGIWRQQWVVVDLVGDELTTKLTEMKMSYVSAIDAGVDMIYSKTIGNRTTEYQLAETEATTYASSGYTGTAPPTVSVWAQINGWTPQQAADDILQTSSNWRAVQQTLRAQRLTTKDRLKKATTYAEIESIRSEWLVFIDVIKQHLGL